MSGRVFSVIAGLAGKGVLAGLIATLPMTAFMLLMQRLLPKVQQFALPPERITAEIAERAGVKVHMNKAEQVAASLVSHLATGPTWAPSTFHSRSACRFLRRSKEPSLA